MGVSKGIKRCLPSAGTRFGCLQVPQAPTCRHPLLLARPTKSDRVPGCLLNSKEFLNPLSPLNLAASTITDNSISITWDVDSLSTGYQLEYMQVGTMTWLVNPAVGPTINTDTAGGLLADTYYDFRVLSSCATGGCYSLTIRIKTLPTRAFVVAIGLASRFSTNLACGEVCSSSWSWFCIDSVNKSELFANASKRRPGAHVKQKLVALQNQS